MTDWAKRIFEGLLIESIVIVISLLVDSRVIQALIILSGTAITGIIAFSPRINDIRRILVEPVKDIIKRPWWLFASFAAVFIVYVVSRQSECVKGLTLLAKWSWGSIML